MVRFQQVTLQDVGCIFVNEISRFTRKNNITGKLDDDSIIFEILRQGLQHIKQIASGTHKTYEDGLREAIEVVVSEDSDDFFGKEYRVSQKHFQREIIDKLQNKLDGK